MSNFQGLESAVKTTCKELGEEFTDNIYDKYGKQMNCRFVDSALTTMLQKPQFRMPPMIQSRLLSNGEHLSIAKTVQRVDSTGAPIKPFVDVTESIRMLKDRM